jgi:hypothetical protein
MKPISVALLALGIAGVASWRTDIKQMQKLLETKEGAAEDAGAEDADLTEGCTAANCRSFDDKRCSCSKFVEEPAFMDRMLGLLTDTLQRMRKVSDKLTEKSGHFSKMWWSSSLSRATKDLQLLQESSERITLLQDLMDSTAVKNLAGDSRFPSWEAPAAVHPINIEIWDDNYGRNTIIGEVGVDLVEGVQNYEKELRPNSHQTSSWVNPNGAKVSFQTNLETSAPKSCDIGTKTCVTLSLTVQCNSAQGLPNTDTGIAGDVTDAYCKVRVKKNTEEPSTKFKTAVVNNDLNPTFDGSPFTLSWDVAVLEPVPTDAKPNKREPSPVPWTSEHSTIGEQLQAQLVYLGSGVFLKENGECKSSAYATACKMLAAMTGETDEETVDQVNAEAKTMIAGGKSSLVQVEEDRADSLVTFHTSRVGCMACHTGRARRRARRNGGRYHGGYRRGGGGGGGSGGVAFVILFIFIILILL